jgi:soluble lytic murein transglycosylase-like protein
MARVNLLSRRVALLLVAVFALISTTTAAQADDPRLEARSTAGRIDLVDLAIKYENGLSVPRDYRRALTLYCQAAQRDDARAYLGLGWMYLNGRGVARDDATAVMWLRKAADRGVSQAGNLLRVLSQISAAGARGCSTVLPGQARSRAPDRGAPPVIRAVIEETAQDVGISANLLHSVIAVESGFNSRAVSPKMAAGLMQLMPKTAARFGVRDRFDPRENVRGGATYLRSLLEMFRGNLTLALAAYNAGEQRVFTHGGVPPYRETISYIAAIKRLCACGE